MISEIKFGLLMSNVDNIRIVNYEGLIINCLTPDLKLPLPIQSQGHTPLIGEASVAVHLI